MEHYGSVLFVWPLTKAYYEHLNLPLPATGLFVQQFVQADIKENINALHCWPFVNGNSVDSSKKEPAMQKGLPHHEVILQFTACTTEIYFGVLIWWPDIISHLSFGRYIRDFTSQDVSSTNLYIVLKLQPSAFKSSHAGDRIFRFRLLGSIPCLLMSWLHKLPGHQQT